APEARALGHRARLARVLGLAVLGVDGGLAETTLVGFLVDLGAAHVAGAAHHEDHRFLPAHELAHDRVDHALLDEGLQPLGGFQRRLRQVTRSGSGTFGLQGREADYRRVARRARSCFLRSRGARTIRRPRTACPRETARSARRWTRDRWSKR